MRFGDPAFLRYITKCAVALIPVEVITGHRQPAWTTVDRDAFEIAVRVCPGFRQPLQVQINIIGYEKIEAAIAVIVEKRASRSPASIALIQQPRLPRDIGKRAVSIVAVKNILTVVSDEDIFKAIVVIVTNGDSTRPTSAKQSSFFRDIGKRPITVVLVQAVAGIRNGPIHTRTAKHKDIQPSVVVVVQEGDTATHRLDDIVFQVEAAVDDWSGKSGLRGHVSEVGEERYTGRLASGKRLHIAGGYALTQSQRRCGRHP